MNIKNNQIIEFIAISWDIPNWDFDYPCVVLKPVLRNLESGTCPETAIEHIMIEFCCHMEVLDDEYYKKYAKNEIKTLKKVVRDRFNGKDTWKTKIREITKQTIQFTDDKDGGFDFKILKSITI